jgi:dihydroorotase-like cyclic amidohydrolase
MFSQKSFLTQLQEAVSSRAKAVIGRDSTYLSLAPGQPADFVLFDTLESGWRHRKSIVEVVYDAGSTRKTVFQGKLVASTG